MKFKFLSLILIFMVFNFNFLESFILKNNTKVEISGYYTKHISGTPRYDVVRFALKPAGENDSEVEITLSRSDGIGIWPKNPKNIKSFSSQNKYTKDQLNKKDLVISFVQKDDGSIEIIANKTPEDIKKEEGKKD